jgi:hypothetical protein
MDEDKVAERIDAMAGGLRGVFKEEMTQFKKEM